PTCRTSRLTRGLHARARRPRLGHDHPRRHRGAVPGRLMRIVDVEAIAISAPNPAGTYWGKASWSAEAASGPPDPLDHWRTTQVPHLARMRMSYAVCIYATLDRIESD